MNNELEDNYADSDQGAMLGLPQTLSDQDIDQDYPSAVDDEGITKTGIYPSPSGRTPLALAAHADFRLTPIVAKIMRNIYPIKGFQSREGNPNKAYSVSYAVVRDIENDLQEWLEKLPSIFTPGGDASLKVLRYVELFIITTSVVDRYQDPTIAADGIRTCSDDALSTFLALRVWSQQGKGVRSASICMCGCLRECESQYHTYYS